MRGGTVIILLGLTAVGAYSLGRQDMPTGKPSAAIVIATSVEGTKPVTLATVPTALQPQPQGQLQNPYADRPSSTTTRSIVPSPVPVNLEKPAQPEVKRKVEAVLTAAAIAPIIIKASRDRYYATGHPCACPKDFTRNGRRCGKTSAYSRPGGAAPFCYPTDVSEAMIAQYRAQLATR